MNAPHTHLDVLTVLCPTCSASVAWLPENAFRPFCSETCQLIDLGEWASDTRAIACTPDSDEWINNVE